MMPASVFFAICVNREGGPAHERENETNTSGGQAEQKSDPEGQWDSQKHPHEPGREVTFVNVPKSGDDT